MITTLDSTGSKLNVSKTIILDTPWVDLTSWRVAVLDDVVWNSHLDSCVDLGRVQIAAVCIYPHLALAPPMFDWRDVAADADQWMTEVDEFKKSCTE